MRKSASLFSLFVMLLAISMGKVWAGEFPDKYFDERVKAPEALTIHVEHVHCSVPFLDEQITLDARVLSVSKTATRLKVGDTIHISYMHTGEPDPGSCTPPSIPVLRAGNDYPAFLTRRIIGDYMPFRPGAYCFQWTRDEKIVEGPSGGGERFTGWGMALIAVTGFGVLAVRHSIRRRITSPR